MKSNGSSKVDRKTVEKNRRIHMKSLCFKLGSLIPKEERNTKDAISQHDHLDHAATYIKNLKARIEKLRRKKNYIINSDDKALSDSEVTHEFGHPVIELRYNDTILEVVLVTGMQKYFTFYEVIQVLLEEGAEIVNVSFSVVSDKNFYTIHSKAISSRIALDASRISERLNELIQ